MITKTIGHFKDLGCKICLVELLTTCGTRNARPHHPGKWSLVAMVMTFVQWSAKCWLWESLTWPIIKGADCQRTLRKSTIQKIPRLYRFCLSLFSEACCNLKNDGYLLRWHVVGLFLFQDLQSRQWHRLPDMPGSKSSPRAAQLKNWVVVLRGFRKSSACRRVFAFHTLREVMPCRRVFAFHTLREVWVEWVKTPNCHCGVASDGDRLIIIGGFNQTETGQVGCRSRAVYQLNEDRDGWDALPMLPRATSHCAASVLNNKLYVLGALDHSSRPQHSANPNSYPIQMLDLAEGVWSEITLSSRVPGTLRGSIRGSAWWHGKTSLSQIGWWRTTQLAGRV